eukprot:g338.t1
MADDDVFDTIVIELKKKKESVRLLKKEKGKNSDAVKHAVLELQALQQKVQALRLAGNGSSSDASEGLDKCDREKLDTLLTRRLFVIPSFDIYGGVKGLYDLGPPTCALKANFLNIWRRHFVLSEGMLEIECTNMTPHKVLDTSGHVGKFTDLMVKDSKSGECLRADHLLEHRVDELLENVELTSKEKTNLEHVRAQADAYTPKELHAKFGELEVVDSAGKPFGQPFPFNLMFKTTIGPEGNRVGFLRPETAQGIFVNFKKLLQYNSGKMPFAAAQIGTGFRNEIAPRNGLLRVREFCMAEIEHFVHPEEKQHPRFVLVADDKLPLFPQSNQLGDGKIRRDISLKEAVSKKIIDNETLAYFMARTYAFLCKVGVKPTHIRFRQHLKSEMAHYASDCWDAEIYLSYGWTECVGIADRSCFDLTKHATASKQDMSAQKQFKEKVFIDVVKIARNKGLMGKAFKRQQKIVNEYLDELSASGAKELDAALTKDGKATVKTCEGDFEVTRDMIKKITVTKKGVTVLKYMPGVIEPSFGVGRILYAIMEHSFDVRPEDAKKGFMRFPVCVAPVKCSVFSVSGKSIVEMDKTTLGLAQTMTDLGVSCKTDTSSVAIGRRYVRIDEIGVPFAITVDFETIDKSVATSEDRYQTVTLRERDTRVQIRVPLTKVCALVRDLADGRIKWDDAMKMFPIENAASKGAEK